MTAPGAFRLRALQTTDRRQKQNGCEMRIYIAGYGNSYRQDDRVGHVLAPMIHQWLENQGIESELSLELQLLPETVYDLAGMDFVLFVDAHAQPLEKGYRLAEVRPDLSPPGANLHIMSPGRLLALMDELGLPKPKSAYLLTVAGHSFDFTEELTPQCLSRIYDAFAAFTTRWKEQSIK